LRPPILLVQTNPTNSTQPAEQTSKSIASASKQGSHDSNNSNSTIAPIHDDWLPTDEISWSFTDPDELDEFAQFKSELAANLADQKSQETSDRDPANSFTHVKTNSKDVAVTGSAQSASDNLDDVFVDQFSTQAGERSQPKTANSSDSDIDTAALAEEIEVAPEVWTNVAAIAIANGIPGSAKSNNSNGTKHHADRANARSSKANNGNGKPRNSQPHQQAAARPNRRSSSADRLEDVFPPSSSQPDQDASAPSDTVNHRAHKQSPPLPPLPPNVFARVKSEHHSKRSKFDLPTPMDLQANSDRQVKAKSGKPKFSSRNNRRNKTDNPRFKQASGAKPTLVPLPRAVVEITPRSPATNQQQADHINAAHIANTTPQGLRILSDAEKRAQQEANVYLDGLFDDYEMLLGDRHQNDHSQLELNNLDAEDAQPGIVGIDKFRQRQRDQANNLNHADRTDPGEPSPAGWVDPGKGRYQAWVTLGTGLLALASAGYAIYAYNQARVAQQDLENVQVATQYRSAGDYDACIAQAQVGAGNEVIATTLQNVLQSCQAAQQDRQAEDQLVLAQSLADSGKLKEALTIAARVSPDADVYTESQQLINASSQRLLDMAQAFYYKGQLDAASNMVAVIPETSELKGKALSSLALWQQEQQQNELILLKAKQNLQQQNWKAAIATARKVSQIPHWQQQAQKIIAEAEAKQIASNQTNQTTVRYSPPSDLPVPNNSPSNSNNNIYNPPAATYYEPAPRYNPEPAPRYYNPPPSYSPPAPVYEPPAAPAPSYDPSPPSRAD
jgi:hypothetical protein